jgi:hypothetical protein
MLDRIKAQDILDHRWIYRNRESLCTQNYCLIITYEQRETQFY